MCRKAILTALLIVLITALCRPAMGGQAPGAKSSYDEKDLIFEQRVVNDEDFCQKCWQEFMVE